MKKVNTFFTLAVIAIAGFTSCTKTLELDPISQISNQSFWKTENDATGALNGMYVKLRTQAAGNLFAWGESRSEVMDRSLGGTAGLQVFFLNELNRSNVGVSAANNTINSTWQGMYAAVHAANLLLKKTPQISFSSENNKNQILAEAYAMRAYAYFMMTKTWGDLPLVLEPTEGSNPDVIMKERSSKAVIMTQIKADIDKALGLFPDNAFKNGRNMWSRPAVNALKAEVYLWSGKVMQGGQDDFRTALKAIEEVEKSDVVLLDKYESVFDYTNKGNKEILMAVRFQDIESSDNVFMNMYIDNSYMNKNTDQSTKDLIGVLGGLPAFTISKLVRDQFSIDDQRRNATFIEIYAPVNGVNTFYGSAVSKFSGTVIGGARKFYDDIVLFRYADVLLMKAEAQNALSLDPTAAINAVRKRAYGVNFPVHTYVNQSVVENDKAILKERLLELTVEGKRWWDLVRFNKAFELVPSLASKPVDNNLLLFPIAETTLSLEPKVKQNLGYN